MLDTQLEKLIAESIDKIIGDADISLQMRKLIQSSLNRETEDNKFRWARLTLSACGCAGGCVKDAMPAAIAMELFALAADIFDDIQDQDNDELPWRKLPNAQALNLGLCLLMLSDKVLESIQNHHLFRQSKMTIAQTGLVACDGQFREFLYEENQQITLDQYFNLVEQKSGGLTACAFKLGALFAEVSESMVSDFGQIAVYYGIMGQIGNDLRDFVDFEKKKDFFNNTKTLPYTYLLSVLNEEEAIRFNTLANIACKRPESFGEKEQEELKQLCIAEGVAPFCLVMYEKFRQKAIEIIKTIPITEEYREKMMELVEKRV